MNFIRIRNSTVLVFVVLVLGPVSVSCGGGERPPAPTPTPVPTPSPTPAVAPSPTPTVREQLNHRQRMAIFIVKLEVQRRAKAAVVSLCFPPPFNQDVPAETTRERYQWECEGKAAQAEYQRFQLSELAKNPQHRGYCLRKH